MKRFDKLWLQDETGRIRCIHCLDPARFRDGQLVKCEHPPARVLR